MENRYMLYSSHSLEIQDRLNYSNENARLVMSEVEYKRQLYNHHNMTQVGNSYNARYGQYDTDDCHNFIKDIRNEVVNELVIPDSKSDSLYINESKINQYFSKNSL